MYVSENDRPATDEEIRKFLEEEIEKLRDEIRGLRTNLREAESETFKYKNAFKILVSEISKK